MGSIFGCSCIFARYSFIHSSGLILHYFVTHMIKNVRWLWW
jgi:hypothetical protein